MLSCFLCEKSGIVKKFTNERLQKCRKILAFREKRNLKYKEVVLPASLQQKGYHIQCFNKFLVLKSTDRKEFDSMPGNTADITRNGQQGPQINNRLTRMNAFRNAPSTSTTQNGVKKEIPKLAEMDLIEAKIESSHDYKLEIPEETYINVPIKKPKTYEMDEPSYVNPDISRGVILKSILTRKTPVKREMTNDSMSFNGMDLFKYGTGPIDDANQRNFNSAPEEIEPKIIKITSLAVCLICNKEQRKIGTLIEFPEILSKEDAHTKVIAYAKAMDDNDLIETFKLTNTYPIHPLCRIEYRNRHEKINRKNCDDDDWAILKRLHDEAFTGLCAFIDEQIIDKNKTYFLYDLFERYKALLFDIQNSSNPFDFENYRIYYLQEKIVSHYYGIIEVTTPKLLKKKVVHKNGTTDFDSAIVANEDFKCEKLAFDLRNDIKSMKKTSDSTKDEIPEKLIRFVGSLIQGPDGRRNSYENCVKINSVCADIVARINMED